MGSEEKNNYNNTSFNFTVDTFVQNTSVLHILCRVFFSPQVESQKSQSVMRHEPRQQMCGGNGAIVVPRAREVGGSALCFLPDRFLYRAAAQTAVRVFEGAGVMGVRIRTTQNKTTQHVNHRTVGLVSTQKICAGGNKKSQDMTGDSAAAAVG